MSMNRIARYMTPCPHSIGANQRLAVAHRFMRDHDIRHLPVMEGGKLVGILSQRDLYFIETLAGVDPEQVAVEEAMTPQPFTVDPRTSVGRVVHEMAEHKYGCSVVVDGDTVVGLFTTTDAMRMLADLWRQQSGRRKTSTSHRGRSIPTEEVER